MRFHLPTLPGRPTTRENSACAYSNYLRKFARMMLDEGHEVLIYGSGPESNDAPCTEFVPTYVGVLEPLEFEDELWAKPNRHAAAAIGDRAEPGDILGVIAGAQKSLVAALPELTAVEYRVGYGGVFTERRVFETYAWMHTVYGALGGFDPHRADGRWYDAVIPPPFDEADFPAEPDVQAHDDYLLFVGRLIQRKGLEVAVELAERTGRRLVVAGDGDFKPGIFSDNIDYIGHVSPDARAELMGDAAALLVPTIYVEPGGGVACEAQMMGTPVLSTDWGCFTETVEQGVGGYRCRTMGQFEWALDQVDDLDRGLIRDRAIATYSLPVVGAQYADYFAMLDDFANGSDFYGPVNRPPIGLGTRAPA